MQISQWQAPSLTVTRENDGFYNRPLEEATLFHFRADSVEIDPHGGAFSIKLAARGEESYEIGQRRVRVAPGAYLFVNAGETYASRIDGDCESISIFIPAHEAADAQRTALSQADRDLLEPHAGASLQEVPQILRSLGSKSGASVMRLTHALRASTHEEAREAARMTLLEALSELFAVAPPGALACLRKRSTRDEVTARLIRARDRIEDSKGQCDSLQELAETACLSPYYFLRMFTALFGVSPVACARRRRLEVALGDLERGGDTKAVIRRAGYTDTRAFNRAVRREFGPASR